MKLGGFLACLTFLVVGCASSSKPPVAVTAGSVTGPAQEAPKAAEAPAAAPAADKPAEKPAVEESEPLPKIVFTPANELRKNTRAKLEAAAKSIKRLNTPAAVSSTLTGALGKPTWIEDEKTKVWTATDTTQCVRLVMEEDGTTNFEVMRTTESKTLSRTTRQNLCTGQLEPVGLE